MSGATQPSQPDLTLPEAEAVPPALSSTEPRRGWQRWQSHGLVLILYTLLTLFYLGPLLARFTTDVPFGGDSWIFYWDLWWVKKALTELGTNPFYTTYVNFPGGASLNFHTLAFLDGLLAIPLQWLGLSLAGAYNSLVLFGYVFSAYGAFLLADKVVADKPSAFVAGLIFGFSPFHWAHLNGQLNFVSIQWMPFYVLFLLKAADDPVRTRRTQAVNIGLAALFLALNALTEWTLAAFLLMFTALYALYRLWQERQEWRTILLGPWLRIALVVGLFVGLTAPVLLPMLGEARSNQNIKYDPQESVVYSADLLSFVTPYEFHPVLGNWSRSLAQKFSGNPAERTAYLGLTVLVLAAVGWWTGRKKGIARQSLVLSRQNSEINQISPARSSFWAVTALAFGLLSLGPLLHVAGRSVFTVFKLMIPLPYATLYYLPFFSIMRTPARFALVVMLALAVLAAFGLKAISRQLAAVGRGQTAKGGEKTSPIPKAGRRTASFYSYASWLVVAGASLLIAFEFAPYVTTAFPNVPPIYDPIRNDRDTSHAVLELPLRQISHYYIAQPAYDKPMIGGYLARQVENPLIEQNPALKTLALRLQTGEASQEQLGQARVRYVMVNWWLLSETEKPQMQTALQTIFGRAPDAEEMEPDGSRLRLSLYIVKP